MISTPWRRLSMTNYVLFIRNLSDILREMSSPFYQRRLRLLNFLWINFQSMLYRYKISRKYRNGH
jgi:hypothetical protein